LTRSINTLGPLIGYHGCDRQVGEAVLAGGNPLAPSTNDYDWLGPGIYFWVDSPERGMDWAREQKRRQAEHSSTRINDPFVIGAFYLKRELDCAVIKSVHTLRKKAEEEPYQTVYGVFEEGKPLYKNAGFRNKTHVQIAVIDPACILGYFRVKL
jgi:hypothetical protein